MAETELINSLMQALNTKLGVAEEVRKNTDAIARLEPMVLDFDKEIRGNGVPGLKEQVRSLDAQVKVLDKKLSDIQESWKYWTRLVIGTLVVQLILGGIALVIALIRMGIV